MKLKRKVLSILMTVCFLASMLVPGAAPALASGNYQSLAAPSVSDDSTVALGGVFIRLTAGSLDDGDSVTFRLPGDFVWAKAGTTDTAMNDEWAYDVTNKVYGEKTGNYIEVPALYSGDKNALAADGVTLTVEQLSDKEIKVTANGPIPTGDEAFMYIYPKNIYVASGFDGAIDLIAEAPGDSGFPSGTVTIGNVSGGKVTVSVSGTDSFTDDDQITLRITEDTAGALSDKKESLKFKLPSGFIWKNISGITTIWGDKNLETVLKDNDSTNGQLRIDEDELMLDLPKKFETNKATSIEFKVYIEVDDETNAKTGDVMVKVSGDSDASPSEFKAGSYGNYDTAIKAADAPTVYAGMLEQKIADIEITESVKESIMNGRTLTLELPENARWGKVDSDSDHSLRIELTSFPGKDGKTAKFTFYGESTDAAELVLEDMEVVLEPGYTGDLNVKVGGTAGLTGELTVAKIVTPVTAETSAKPEARIGTTTAAGDVTITETQAAAIKKNKWVILDLPTGVRFANKPKVEVLEGDINIDLGSVKTQADDNEAVFYIDGESSTASKIKISNINYIVDRTVAEGDIVFKVKGAAVSDVNDATEVADYYGSLKDGYIQIEDELAFMPDAGPAVFSRTQTNAKVVNATVTTPAPIGSKGTASFVIGNTKYTLNGVEATMDVAPYLKSDRTFLPIRYVANALGVADANIMWNGAEQSVVIIKGDRVIKLTIGSNVMLINGVPFTMDVAPELVDPGRTMLPLRAVAQALGADVQWDAATQTVTINTL